MDGLTIIAYGAFGVSTAALLVRFGNRPRLRANPRVVTGAGRWAVAGLGLAALAAVLWLAINGRWTTALMLASFTAPALVQAAPRWRSAVAGLYAIKQGRRDRAGHRCAAPSLSVAAAHELLGLAACAAPEEIRAAHRRLRQRVDPAFGGTRYLAAKVDEARDILLKL